MFLFTMKLFRMSLYYLLLIIAVSCINTSNNEDKHNLKIRTEEKANNLINERPVPGFITSPRSIQRIRTTSDTLTN